MDDEERVYPIVSRGVQLGIDRETAVICEYWLIAENMSCLPGAVFDPLQNAAELLLLPLLPSGSAVDKKKRFQSGGSSFTQCPVCRARAVNRRRAR